MSCKRSLLPRSQAGNLVSSREGGQSIAAIPEGQDGGSDGDRGRTKAMGSGLDVGR